LQTSATRLRGQFPALLPDETGPTLIIIGTFIKLASWVFVSYFLEMDREFHAADYQSHF
jgi:hypothetical protein